MSKFKRDEVSFAPESHGKRDAAFMANSKQAVLRALEVMLSAGRPPCLPDRPAAYMVDYLFEPPQPEESIRQLPSGAFVTPYRDRMLYLCRTLMNLDDFNQRAILAYREDGIFWRGDSIEFLGMIATAKMEASRPSLRPAGKASHGAPVRVGDVAALTQGVAA